VAIGFARRAEDAEASEAEAQQLLRRYGNIQRIGSLSFAEVQHATSLEDFEVLRAICLMELGRRAGRAEKGDQRSVDCPEDLYDLVKHLKYEKQEHFVAIALDSKGKVITSETVHIGTLNMSIVGPREIFRFAVREGASSLAVAHNHPSGDPTPSPEDLDVTRKLAEVGKMLDIPLIDHIIVGDPLCLSFVRKGLI
jgi:DNA repair protein RadC